MNKLVIVGLACVLAGGMISCGGKKGDKEADSAAALDSIVSMVETVNEVDSAKQAQTQEQDQGLIVTSVREIYNMRPPESFTPDFQQVIDEVNKKDAGEIGFFDYDILTLSQDPGNLKDVEILDLIGNDTAKVKVTGESYGDKGYVVILTKLTDGVYLVDDVEGFDGKSLKDAAKSYLNGN
ncbi:MAG: hypothetical protein HDS79_05165 [Bacteroidales bacterium]|nr:hypothetical protein [Bacteroidales bacterium]MDE7466381.1 hypothetical protein [Muribaculaceae bacterium]